MLGLKKIKDKSAPSVVQFSHLLAVVLTCASIASAAVVPKAQELVTSKKYTEALELLRSATDQDDIYVGRIDRHTYKARSSDRRLLIVDTLLALGRKDDARGELRSLYEFRGEPAYSIPSKANILLIQMETEKGYEAFEGWLQKYGPADPYDHQSVQHITSLKKAIEQNQFEGSLEILEGIPGYNVFMTPPRSTLPWQQQAVVSYLVRNPLSQWFLKNQLSKHSGDLAAQPWGGVIFCLGEISKPEAIPALRRALETEKNYYIKLETVFALVKCGDKDAAPEVLKLMGGSLENQRYINQLLRNLTGKDFGPIESAEAGSAVREQWKAYLNKDETPNTPTPRPSP